MPCGVEDKWVHHKGSCGQIKAVKWVGMEVVKSEMLRQCHSLSDICTNMDSLKRFKRGKDCSGKPLELTTMVETES